MSRLLRPWFLSEPPDVLALLCEQARITAVSMEALARWTTTGDVLDEQAVRDAEHAGDDARRALVHALRDVLSTPLDQEDLYVIADRLDTVQNLAKDLVREAELARWHPDEHATRMGARAQEAAAHLVDAIAALPDAAETAGRAADAATKAARGMEHEHRAAIVALATSTEPSGRLIVTADLYRGFEALAEAIVGVSHRVWFSVLKQA